MERDSFDIYERMAYEDCLMAFNRDMEKRFNKNEIRM
jgi:hypothetical protein